MRRSSLLFFLLLLGLVYVPGFLFAESASKRPWKAEDTFRINSISDLQISPDGSYLFFMLSTRNLEDDRDYSRLWAYQTKQGNLFPLTQDKSAVSNPRLSRDGTKIAFFSGEGGKLGLWIMNSDGTSKKRLAELEKSNANLGMRGNELCWSPDGKMLAYNAAGSRYYKNNPTPLTPPTGSDVMVVNRLLYKAFYYYSDLRRTYIWLISAEGGEPQQISFGDFDYHSISYSPDGKWIACVSNRTGNDDFNSNNDICLISTEGKEMLQLTNSIGPEYAPTWSPDGTMILYLGRMRDKRSKESDAELHKVYVIPKDGGNPTNLTASLDRWSGSPIWSADSQNVYFTAQNSGKVGLYMASKQGSKVDCLFEEKGQVLDFCPGRDKEIYFAFTDFTNPTEIYRIGRGDKTKTQLTSFHQHFSDEVEIVESEYFAYPSFDGMKIEGWLMKPLGYREGKKYPLIHAIHGGPHSQYGYNLPRTAMYQFFAASGYAVLLINYRGSSGRGQEFSDLIVGDLCGGEYRDLMIGLDYVLEKYPFIDSNRLGVTGGSYGGYLANWIITQTDRYKAAVSVASISDILTQWATGGDDLWFESDGGFVPIDNFEKAWNMSPIKHIKNCRTPTLFVHGAWDFCTNLNQAELMFTALKKLGVDTVLAIYPDEGHGFRRLRHVNDYHLRSLAWFDTYLK